jgi:L-amino acid N-acyltransferase YncA
MALSADTRVHVREATPQDVPAIAAIVRHYVATSAALWVLEPPTDAEYRATFTANTAAGYPVLVAVDGKSGAVVGYASAAAFRARCVLYGGVAVRRAHSSGFPWQCRTLAPLISRA